MRELTIQEIAAVSGGAGSYDAGYRAGYATARFLSYSAMVLGIGAAISAAMAASA